MALTVKKLLSIMGMTGLFVFAMMNFIIITQSDAGIDNKLIDNEIINETYGDLAEGLESTDAEAASNTFGENPPTQQAGELGGTAIVGPTTTIKTIILGFWAIFVKLPMKILGVSSAVMTIIYSILFVFLMIGIWAIWKGAITQ